MSTIIIKKDGGGGGVTLPIGITDVTDLQGALDGKTDANSPITPSTKTKVTYDAKGLITNGTDALISDVSGLVDALNSKANTVHTHAISDVTALQTTLDTRRLIVPIIDPTTALVTDDVGYFRVPSDLGGKRLINITGYVYTVFRL